MKAGQPATQSEPAQLISTKPVHCLTIFLSMALLAACPALWATTAPKWQWGSEGENLCEYIQPEGLLGCRWLNYGNVWATQPILFEEWTTPYNQDALCLSGTIATLMIHYRWPEESRFNGYLGEKSAEIKHRWSFDDIVDFTDCKLDRPELRSLKNCTVPGQCRVSDELGRLVASGLAATNYEHKGGTYSNSILKEENLIQMLHVIKNRVGFTNVESISFDKDGYKDTLMKYLADSDNPQPVIAIKKGHVFLLDGAREENGNLEVHILNYYNTCGHHTAWWSKPEDYPATLYLYNLDPTVRMRARESKTVEYLYGDRYIPHTSDSRRQGTFRFQSNSPGPLEIKATVTCSIASAGDWLSLDGKYPKQTFTFGKLGASGTSQSFNFEVPAGGEMKITLNMENTGASDAHLRLIMDDRHIQKKLLFKHKNAVKLSLLERGSLNVEGTKHYSPIAGEGILIKNLGIPMLRADVDGNIFTDVTFENQENWLSRNDNRMGGLTFRDPDGVIAGHFSSSSALNLRGSLGIWEKLEEETDNPLDATVEFLKIIGPDQNVIRIGEIAPIRWTTWLEEGVDVYLLVDNKAILLNRSGSLYDGKMDWKVPETVRDSRNNVVSLIDAYVGFRVQIYSDPSISSKKETAFKVAR